MSVRIQALAAALVLSVPFASGDNALALVSKHKEILWRSPGDIRSRNLIYGAGGAAHAPHGPFRFVKEDLDGSNPKYRVVDQNGVTWKVKLGREAQPETAATRIVWAAGYFTDEDYYFPEIHVDGLPAKLHRGRDFVDAGGNMRGARLERNAEGAKKAGGWKWKENHFTGTREFNGLRTLMAMLNNWDVKDKNTAIYEDKFGNRIYSVSDLGASLAAPGFAYPARKAKGNLEQYRKSSFVCDVNDGFVNFCAPGRPALVRIVDVKSFISRLRMRRVGDHIPRADARWMGEILAGLSPSQIRDAFRAAGYSPDEVEGFARVFESRIGALLEL